jgi:hypothetical protein
MRKLLTRIRGVLGMGLLWAAAWAVGGVLIGVTSRLLPGLPWDAFFEVFDAPLPALAVPGFLGGVLFSTVLGIAGRRRRFDELSIPRFAAWGALAGLLLGAIPFAIGTPEAGTSAWLLGVTIAGPTTVLCAISASASLALARRAEKRESLRAGAEVNRLGWGDGERRGRESGSASS